MAIDRMPKTNHAAIRSAVIATAGFSPCARSIKRSMCDSTVSSPTWLTRIVSGLSVFRLPPTTSSPARQLRGTLSPVSKDSSTADSPSSTVPSTGMTSPGRTSSRSPISNSATGTVFDSPPGALNLRAVAGVMRVRRSLTSAEYSRERNSKKRAVDKKNTNITIES